MIQQLIKKIKELDKSIICIMKKGVIFSFIIAILSALILITYKVCYISPDLYYIGLSLFQTSLMFIVIFIIYGLAFDKILKELN